MTTINLKKKIFSRLKKTSDKNVLEDIYRLLELQDINDEPYLLSKEQLKKVRLAQKQIKQGKIISHEKANKEIEKWLEK